MKKTTEKQPNKNSKQSRQKSLIALNNMKFLYLSLFILLAIHLAYFVVFSSDNLAINTYNPRLDQLEKNILRGKILDAQGEILAETVIYEDEEQRIYPFENAFSHVVGYSIQGKTGIEAAVDLSLLRSHMPIYDLVVSELTNKKKIGDDVVTTLNTELQVTASDLLDGQKGAIIAIEPATGKILCMVSKPDFNPNDLILNWENLINDEENSTLLNRVTQGLYPPGSTFKILTTMEYLNENPTDPFVYTCEGSDDFEGKVIHCYNGTAHGEETLIHAFSKSCNTAFATIGESMDFHAFDTLTKKMLFNQPLPYDMPTSVSSFKLKEGDSSAQVAETVIGQGETMITPLHNALIVSAIANGGLLMKPYVIDRIDNTDGTIVHQYLPESYKQLIDPSMTKTITEYMVDVVNNGTGVNAASDNYQVACKTGSAENPFGDDHAWFVGFAPAENPKIVLAIVVENAGSSGSSAVPMAKELFDIYLKK
ncbi:MAG: penicillin-binding protein 2 [Vallitaleaceae bacterium]|nr:penicillin-binding protein 2 [Vallitaleaceae bacterium]